MHRFLIDEMDNDTAIFREDAQHMARILRLKPGDHIAALDGDGRQAEAVIADVSREEIRAKLSAWRQAEGEPLVRVSIFQGICRAERFETAVQKCTELGAAGITPLALTRCEFSPEDVNKRLQRLNKIAREAAKQSGRGIVPKVNAPLTLSEVPFEQFDLVLCPYEEAAEHGLRHVLHGRINLKNIAVIIGPEGGLDPSEAEYCTRRGAQVVTLGKLILRTETAAPAVLAALMAMTGQWDGELD